MYISSLEIYKKGIQVNHSITAMTASECKMNEVNSVQEFLSALVLGTPVVQVESVSILRIERLYRAAI